MIEEFVLLYLVVARLKVLLFAAILSATQGAEAVAISTPFYAEVDSAGLVNQRGAAFTHSYLAGRLVLVQFIYTQCSSVCPVQTYSLVELRKTLPSSLKERVLFLSVSLDPLSDMPTRLAAYAKRYGIDDSGWTFATGKPLGIEQLASALSLYGAAKSPYKVENHGTSLWLIDAHGQVLQRYSGDRVDVPRLRLEMIQIDALSRVSEDHR